MMDRSAVPCLWYVLFGPVHIASRACLSRIHTFASFASLRPFHLPLLKQKLSYCFLCVVCI